MHCGWGKGRDTRKRNTDNRKPEVRTAAILVLVRDGLEHEWCSGTYVSTVLSHHQVFWRTDPLYVGGLKISLP
jgi:hypothetical protein